MRLVNFMDELARDVPYAGRNFRRNPGFAALVMAII
jgi:hypothetical protein